MPARAEADVLGDRWTAAFNGAAEFADCCTADVQLRGPARAAAAQRARRRSPPTPRSCARRSPTPTSSRAGPALLRGENACVPWRLTGTHTGDVGVLPATGKELALHGLHYLELADGRVRRARGFFDLYEAATQLGLLPERGGWARPRCCCCAASACAAEPAPRLLDGDLAGLAGVDRAEVVDVPAVSNFCSNVPPPFTLPESNFAPGPSSLVTVWANRRCSSTSRSRPS